MFFLKNHQFVRFYASQYVKVNTDGYMTDDHQNEVNNMSYTERCRQMAHWVMSTPLDVETVRFAEYVAIMRRQLRMSQTALANQMGVAPWWIEALEIYVLPREKIESIRTNLEQVLQITYDEFNTQHPNYLNLIVTDEYINSLT